MISDARLIIFGIHTPSELTPNAVGLKRAETSSDLYTVCPSPTQPPEEFTSDVTKIRLTFLNLVSVFVPELQ